MPTSAQPAENQTANAGAAVAAKTATTRGPMMKITSISTDSAENAADKSASSVSARRM